MLWFSAWFWQGQLFTRNNMNKSFWDYQFHNKHEPWNLDVFCLRYLEAICVKEQSHSSEPSAPLLKSWRRYYVNNTGQHAGERACFPEQRLLGSNSKSGACEPCGPKQARSTFKVIVSTVMWGCYMTQRLAKYHPKFRQLSAFIINFIRT